MRRPDIKTTKNVVPMIYAYTTPEIARHEGWTKIGYTEQDVETRIKQQTHTADVVWNIEWKGNAIFDDGSGDRFTDKDFHAYLRKLKVEQEEGKNNEWFHITGKESNERFYEFRSNRGHLGNDTQGMPEAIFYSLRNEQEDAITKTIEYIDNYKNRENNSINKNGKFGPEFLWNAKPRFGKTLSVYDLCKRIDAKTVLIVTNRPAIANSWYGDYIKFLGRESGYLFVSEVDALKGKQYVLTRKEYANYVSKFDDDNYGKCIEFVSLQDLKGSMYFSDGGIDKLKEVKDICWDILVVDEAHEGVDTYKTDFVFNNIKRKFTLHLSGTPFKALSNDKFESDAIYNWTYADEQRAKKNWHGSLGDENPYKTIPKLKLFTYKMSEIIKDEIKDGIEIDGETENYAFDLNEFFSTKNGKFKYDSSVDKFLDAMTIQEKYPFSTPELRNELKHTFWILDRVDSAKALAEKLKNHHIYRDYEIVLAAGDGKLDESDDTKKSYDKVVEAIEKYDKTITLSVGQLTTGVTIPEWTAVLMLSNMKSPALYMQAAFRAQNPCIFKNGSRYERKENAYVFDFDPARTLNIFEKFANNLSPRSDVDLNDSDYRRENIRELLNFFPVIGEDENGELIELDAEKVITMPIKIRSKEVVKRGFICNYLFRDISRVFVAPQNVMEIITNLEPVKETKVNSALTGNIKDRLSLNDDGDVEIPEEVVESTSKELFGKKIFLPTEEVISDIPKFDVDDKKEKKKRIEELKKSTAESVKNIITKGLINTVKESYGKDLTKSDEKKLTKISNEKIEEVIDESFENYAIDMYILEKDMKNALDSCDDTNESHDKIKREFEKKHNDINQKLQEELKSKLEKHEEESKMEIVRTIETSKIEREKAIIEGNVKEHLRGFSRTIPSFLMAYGTEDTTLENFEKNIPDDVFKEVTSISIEEFVFLRDGGEYIDPNTNETETFDGKLFDSDVFNESIKEFLMLKQNLASYFDENSVEDIFDYIPPQKTNQIFTPKFVVKKMVDMLEEENPGCFDLPDKTFIDLYMKSGLYIAEIVKRLYKSENMKKLYPDKNDRLKHIFENQVYGLAPTEIIYKIATNYILGFDNDYEITKHNFRQVDTLPYAKDGTLKEKLDEIYGE